MGFPSLQNKIHECPPSFFRAVAVQIKVSAHGPKTSRELLSQIHAACVKEGTGDDGYINYVKGANIAGFRKVADAMCQQGY